VLINSSGDSVTSVDKTTNGGTASLNYNVGNETGYIIMNYYWNIDGNYTNSTREWYILNSVGTDWSIKNFFDDFSSYLSVGLFGLDNFGKAIIIFIIIFVFVGIMSYKFGLTSTAGIGSLTFGLVLFFDIGLNLLEDINPIGAVPHFLTIFVGVILAGILFREVYK